MSDSYDDYEAKIQLAEHAWEERVVKTEHDKQIEIAQAYQRGWNAALAQQEPVAWMHNFIEGNVITHRPADIGRYPERWTPLYTAPCQTCQSLAMAVMNDQTYHEKVIPKREWVGLTDQEIGEVISGQFAERNYWVKITKALESKLKEKNT